MFYRVLAMTYFRTGMTALSSAQRCFTVLFGMGRGGASALWSPRIRCVDRLPAYFRIGQANAQPHSGRK